VARSALDLARGRMDFGGIEATPLNRGALAQA